jgi:HlyD family secretion protein
VRLVEPAASTKVSALGVEEQRVNVVIDAPEAPYAPWLGDGYRVDVSVTVWETRDALAVPASALVRSGDGAWAVYAVERGRARLRRVQVGEVGGGAAQILGGVRDGDTVIVFPSDKLRAGLRVTTR